MWACMHDRREEELREPEEKSRKEERKRREEEGFEERQQIRPCHATPKRPRIGFFHFFAFSIVTKISRQGPTFLFHSPTHAIANLPNVEYLY